MKFEIVSASEYSILILEPPRACSSCLEVTLQSWLGQQVHFPRGRAPFLIISESEDARQTFPTAKLFGLESDTFIDPSAVIYAHLHLPASFTVALLSDRKRRVIYAQALSSRSPERFASFLEKVRRYLGD